MGGNFLKTESKTDLKWAIREPSGDFTAKVINALPPPDVKIDQRITGIKYVHRRWKDADIYFFFNESAQRQISQINLAGNGNTQLWDVDSGQIKALTDSVSTKGRISMPLTLEPYQTKFIVIGTN